MEAETTGHNRIDFRSYFCVASDFGHENLTTLSTVYVEQPTVLFNPYR